MKLNSFQGDLYIWGKLKLLPFLVVWAFYSVTRVNSAPEA